MTAPKYTSGPMALVAVRMPADLSEWVAEEAERRSAAGGLTVTPSDLIREAIGRMRDAGESEQTKTKTRKG